MALASEIDSISSIDLQLANLWDFIILDNPNIGNIVDLVTTSVNDVFGVLNKFKVQSLAVPFPSLEKVTLLSGHKSYTKRNFEEDFTVTLYEDTSFSSFNFFQNWLEKVYNFDDNVFQINPPTKTGILNYYGSDLVTPTATFMYENMKMISIENLAPDRSNGGPLSITVNLTFDKMSQLTIVGAAANIARSAASAISLL